LKVTSRVQCRLFDPDFIALDAVVGGVGIAGVAELSGVEFGAVRSNLGILGQ
jgi:hypothetical protein